jgi:phage gp36-like protein
MAYATEQDVLTRYEAAPADPGDAKLTMALDDASALIDGYLAGRYPVPIAQPPQILCGLCVDVSIYNLARSHDGLTEDIRARYEDALRYLRSVAKGEIELPGQEPQAGSGTGAVVLSGPPRLFGRGKGW